MHKMRSHNVESLKASGTNELLSLFVLQLHYYAYLEKVH